MIELDDKRAVDTYRGIFIYLEGAEFYFDIEMQKLNRHFYATSLPEIRRAIDTLLDAPEN